MKKYKLIVTEEQLGLIANCVEDLSRFMGGQTELNHTVAMLDNSQEVDERLRHIKPLVTPDLPLNASYGWSGGSCPNKYQHDFIAKTYCIYREILHQMTLERHKSKDCGWSVYLSDTLTCEAGGELPIIEVIEENK